MITIPNNIILSRTDGIGDMVLMLPMAGILKKKYPQLTIAVLGKAYTRALVAACSNVDEFIDEADFFTKQIMVGGLPPQCIIHVRTNRAVAIRAKALQIPMRIGTSSRLYHWLSCNKLLRLGRKNSTLHEAQLNIKLLSPLGITTQYSIAELALLFGLTNIEPLAPQYEKIIDKNKYNLIVHAKSQGSSREWPMQHFVSFINLLPEAEYNIILSGVEKEQPYVKKIIQGLQRRVINITGQVPLQQFISIIQNSDGLLANATGPVHVAAALGIQAMGLYPPIVPLHPGRWSPIGQHVKVFVSPTICKHCVSNNPVCACMLAIAPTEVLQYVSQLKKQVGIA